MRSQRVLLRTRPRLSMLYCLMHGVVAAVNSSMEREFQRGVDGDGDVSVLAIGVERVEPFVVGVPASNPGLEVRAFIFRSSM